MSIFANFLLLALSAGGCDRVKYKINRHNGKIRGVLNNEQLKYPTQAKNRESLNFVFLFFQLCKNGHSLFFPWGLQLISRSPALFSRY